MPIQRTFTQTL